jgi:hypothetical protein
MDYQTAESQAVQLQMIKVPSPAELCRMADKLKLLPESVEPS